MPQKTITVEHEGRHAADQAELDEAAAAAGVTAYRVARSVNESGVSTKYTLEWDETEPPAADKTDPPAKGGKAKDPAPPA